jgi:hypothetical protein
MVQSFLRAINGHNNTYLKHIHNRVLDVHISCLLMIREKGRNCGIIDTSKQELLCSAAIDLVIVKYYFITHWNS